MPKPGGRFRAGSDHPRWSGGTRISNGYRFLRRADHPRSDSMGYVQEHIVVVENAIGRRLPSRCVVHHVDENRLNNSTTNLVACNDRAYHKLIHARMGALKSCGNANWKKCPFCHEYDDPSRMRRRVAGREQHEHAECVREYARRRRTA